MPRSSSKLYFLVPRDSYLHENCTLPTYIMHERFCYQLKYFQDVKQDDVNKVCSIFTENYISSIALMVKCTLYPPGGLNLSIVAYVSVYPVQTGRHLRRRARDYHFLSVDTLPGSHYAYYQEYLTKGAGLPGDAFKAYKGNKPSKCLFFGKYGTYRGRPTPTNYGWFCRNEYFMQLGAVQHLVILLVITIVLAIPMCPKDIEETVAIEKRIISQCFVRHRRRGLH